MLSSRLGCLDFRLLFSALMTFSFFLTEKKNTESPHNLQLYVVDSSVTYRLLREGITQESAIIKE